jgi:hypothetical protein
VKSDAPLHSPRGRHGAAIDACAREAPPRDSLLALRARGQLREAPCAGESAGVAPRSGLRRRLQTAQVLGIPSDELGLLGPDQETLLPNEALISDHRIRDDSILYAVRKEGSGYEKVRLVEGDPSLASSA